ncbi:MAG TPA: hypothetical protein VGN83_08250 [Falsiroseomonas sp.]|jgi:hypothetical protein|nr:hypothetical protein [Falsiroseomonas sp.]
MPALARRSVLLFPLVVASALPARAAPAVPAFPHWIGRTALLRGDAGAARLLLGQDGTGMITVRLLLFCRALPIRSWRLGEDGMSVRYSRVSARDPARMIAGEARILPDQRRLLWIEAAEHMAEFEGFADPDSAGRCG